MFSEVVEALAPLGYPVYDTVAPSDARLPYFLIWGTATRPHPEQALDSAASGVLGSLGVTGVAGTPEGARTVMRRSRERLQPDLRPYSVGAYELKLVDGQPAQVDRDTTITNTNRHPAYQVDVYDVRR